MLTRDEILAMPVGRELDALVAEKVMGQSGYDFDDTHWYCPTCKAWVHPAQVTFQEVHTRCRTEVVSDWCDEEGNVMPHYSTDISAAWEVAEKFPQWKIILNKNRVDNRVYIETEDGSGFFAKDLPIPEAICKAALLAIMEGSQ